MTDATIVTVDIYLNNIHKSRIPDVDLQRSAKRGRWEKRFPSPKTPSTQPHARATRTPIQGLSLSQERFPYTRFLAGA